MTEELQRKIVDTTLEIESIETWINKNPLEKNTQYLIKYSIIRACSTIEVAFKKIIYDNLITGCNEEVKRYLENKILNSSMNPKTGNIENLLQEINSTWKTKFQEKMKDIGEKKADLNSLVSLRNEFAHGYSISVTIRSVKRYYMSGVVVLKELENIIKSNNE